MNTTKKLIESMSIEELQQYIGTLGKAIGAYEDQIPTMLAANETGTTIDDQSTDEELNNQTLETEAAPKLDEMRHQLAEAEAELHRRIHTVAV